MSALASLAGLAHRNPRALYCPTPAQAAFHADPSARRLIRAGNQIGKTWAGAHEAWTQALVHPRTVGLVVAADWAGYRDVVARTMWEQAPRHLLAASSEYNAARGWKNQHVALRNGSQILFRSARSASTSVAGIRAHWLWIDEPPPRALWGELLSRIAVEEGRAWMTFTPVGADLSWLREIVERGWSQHVVPLSAANCPHRTPESIQLQIASYGAWERAQRVNAEWEGVTLDRALEGFNEASVDAAVPLLEWLVGLGFDHGESAGKEAVVLVFYAPAKHLLWVIDEYVCARSTTPEEDARALEAMLARHHLDSVAVDTAYGDTNSLGKGSGGGRVNDLLGYHLGLRIATPNKRPGSVAWGTRLLDVALRRGHLRVHPRCGATIASLKHWRGGDDEWSHLVDALRYVATPILESYYRGPELDRLRLTRG